MRFFIDTANIEEIKEANELGVICGVTTNPSLIAKEGRDFIEVVKEISTIVDGPISAEVISLDHKGMVEEADKLSKILLKVPVKAGENGKIFGGVSAKEIAELLKSEYKIEIDKKKIDLKETIKTLGVRIVSIKLYEGVIGNLKIDVISK